MNDFLNRYSKKYINMDIMLHVKGFVYYETISCWRFNSRSFNDYTYFYPRFGYGTKLQDYFNNVEVINLALSGRSSKSYLKEKNYLKLKELLKDGDYLLIGFGHNDEKADDESRFTDAEQAS